MSSDGEKQNKQIDESAHDRMKQQFGEKCLDLLTGAGLPLQFICHAFAYGSGAIPQQNEDPTQKMVSINERFKKILE